ncbi:glycerophosphodiester phosphodiesterase [Paenibacillus radicis (ex Gao et al. 2016)]|uniref:Glycerophosphoryl diester phosphodiesterase n=1 Tax=Paenibacillus radicis (ex Gao et al. 2016) TaxID=1737354 RepID=A0A917LVI7_9BACL|nr:glycerophosphodiester phosphodiesterase [Paenibacillus radicis (ex Gao et al. 2016)]GGG60218.1 glycerophosphoryl diester phosphodiesterase [Paenibacillus radicis (ex Gao et al. 2016)]
MEKLKILGHRGASGYAPENTMEAFRLAIQQHADGFEIDIHITKDGEIVVIHDDTIDRTSNGTGNVTDLTLAELKQFNYNAGFEQEYATAEIPTLSQVLELVKTHNLYLNIEIKDIMTNVGKYDGLNVAAAKLVQEYELVDQVIFSSFNHSSMVELKQACPEISTGLLHFSKLYQGEEYAKSANADALHPLFSIVDKSTVEQAHQQGIQINAWTVNQAAVMEEMIDAGVDAIITDFPDVAYRLRESKQA